MLSGSVLSGLSGTHVARSSSMEVHARLELLGQGNSEKLYRW